MTLTLLMRLARTLLMRVAALAVVTAPFIGAAPTATHTFTLTDEAEVVADVRVKCAACDWGAKGSEGVVLDVRVDDEYSQHVVVTRREMTAAILLGALPAGRHRVIVARDARSARGAGDAEIQAVTTRAYAAGSPEHAWLSRAPVLRARTGSLEAFSDVPLLMYAEENVPGGEDGSSYRFQYTVVFSNEDGGTPVDRLMATWGRTTDIEFVYGVTTDGRELIQGDGHTWQAFGGPRANGHPELWVSTLNNMVADTGPAESVRFAPAPTLVALGARSREAAMDEQPWTYAVTSAEIMREGHVAADARAGSGRIVDPRRYATVEACAEVTGATLAMDIGVAAGGETRWIPTDQDPRYRIARGGCFRGGAPLPAGSTPADVTGLRVRALGRAPEPNASSGPMARVVLRRVNRLFMLGPDFMPRLADAEWAGELAVPVNGTPVMIPLRRARRAERN